MKILSYFSFVDYGTVYVFDPAYYVEGERPCDFQDIHMEQGFFAWPGMFVFFLLTSESVIHIDVYLDEPVQLSNDTIRAIQVPFKVIGDEGIVVEPLMGESRFFALPKGDYALVFEQRYMYKWTEADMALDSTDPEWLEDRGTWDVEIPAGQPVDFRLCPMIMGRIWLNPATNVEAKILVQDTAANSNFPLNPVYPLVIDEPPAHISRQDEVAEQQNALDALKLLLHSQDKNKGVLLKAFADAINDADPYIREQAVLMLILAKFAFAEVRDILLPVLQNPNEELTIKATALNAFEFFPLEEQAIQIYQEYKEILYQVGWHQAIVPDGVRNISARRGL